MDIFTRFINGLKYDHYKKLAYKAIDKCKKHKNDTDDTEFKKWGLIAVDNLEKTHKVALKLK